jgi:hypothetical protein
MKIGVLLMAGEEGVLTIQLLHSTLELARSNFTVGGYLAVPSK